jgi:hypothetical protein
MTYKSNCIVCDNTGRVRDEVSGAWEACEACQRKPFHPRAVDPTNVSASDLFVRLADGSYRCSDCIPTTHALATLDCFQARSEGWTINPVCGHCHLAIPVYLTGAPELTRAEANKLADIVLGKLLTFGTDLRAYRNASADWVAVEETTDICCSDAGRHDRSDYEYVFGLVALSLRYSHGAIPPKWFRETLASASAIEHF